MRGSATDNRDHDRSSGKACALHFLLLGREFRCLLEGDFDQGRTKRFTLLTAQNDEAPRRQLAMIGHARGKRQHGLDLGAARTRFGQLQCRDGAPCGQILQKRFVLAHENAVREVYGAKGLEFALRLVFKWRFR